MQPSAGPMLGPCTIGKGNSMEEIKGVARAVIRPGKLAEYKALCE